LLLAAEVLIEVTVSILGMVYTGVTRSGWKRRVNLLVLVSRCNLSRKLGRVSLLDHLRLLQGWLVLCVLYITTLRGLLDIIRQVTCVRGRRGGLVDVVYLLPRSSDLLGLSLDKDLLLTVGADLRWLSLWHQCNEFVPRRGCTIWDRRGLIHNFMLSGLLDEGLGLGLLRGLREVRRRLMVLWGELLGRLGVIVGSLGEAVRVAAGGGRRLVHKRCLERGLRLVNLIEMSCH